MLLAADGDLRIWDVALVFLITSIFRTGVELMWILQEKNPFLCTQST